MQTDGTQTQQNTQGANGAQQDFKVSAAVLEKYPRLVELIKKTESMSNDEREYWFQILPIMTTEQVERLKKILEDEEKQLAELDAKYQDELNNINDKHVDDWKLVEQQKEEVREKREAEEHAAESEEKAAEDALLDQLDQI